jgi:hypothetical protein
MVTLSVVLKTIFPLALSKGSKVVIHSILKTRILTGDGKLSV